MDDQTRRSGRKAGETTEGVRIIGAEEAEQAIGRDDVARRLPDDAPRFGDRPQSPPEDGPRPAIRFPLSAASDPGEVDRPPLVPPTPPGRGSNVTMPHWTEPATGEVPKIFASDNDQDDDLDAWSSFTSSSPRWRGEGTARDDDEYDDFSRLADDDTRIGALDSRDRPDPDDFFSFDELEEEPEEPTYASPPPRPISSDPRRTQAARPTSSYERPEGAGRDMPVAIAVGLGFAAIALVAFKAGPKFAVALVAVVIVVSAAEFFNAARTGGHQPATLLGISASASLVLAAYWKGEAAIPLVLFLTVVFGLIWYLWGAGGRGERPVSGLGVTLLGVCYVGLLGSFGALILTLPDGIGILLGAILATVGYDLGGFVVGRNAGRQPLSAASPNKTIEGLFGGMICAVLLAVLVAGRIEPWSGDFLDSVWLGIAVAVAAPLGDLCESLLKRDIGVKDMSDALPGHGGVLDRFDAMLFALPATYYAARILLF